MAEVQAQAYEYVVEGNGEFPWDMLRHDRAWPKSSSEVSSLVAYSRTANRQVRLMGLSEPTEDRWRSFGWIITKFDRTSTPVKTMTKSRVR